MPRLKRYFKTKKRKTANRNRFYDTAQWKSIRIQKIRLNPLCEICEKNGDTMPGIYVDHHRPIRLFPHLRDKEENLTTMCNECHGRKTAEVDAKSQTPEQWELNIKGTVYEK